jgi:hypothetical protein
LTATAQVRASPPGSKPAEPRRSGSGAVWAIAAATSLLLISLGIVLWARTRPSFDAYGWLVWGHQTIAGSLSTNAAPSWKPLPYVFTVPFALFGHYELWLWMITCVAISLGGAVAAGRIAYRLTLVPGAPIGTSLAGSGTAPPWRRYAALAAALFAATALLGIRDWWHYMLSAQSDTMIVALSLGAIDCHLSGRPRWAFVLGVLASLGRPEVWPFLALYSIWSWRAIPSMRWLVVSGIVVLLLLWFGVPALTSRSPFVSASNAFGSGRRLKSDRVFGTIDRFLDLHETPLEIAALLGVLWAALRRDRVVLGMAAGAALWVIVEVAFSLHGWPGLGRYMFPAAGVMVVIAGVFVGWLLADLGALLAERLRAPHPGTAGVVAGVALAAVLVATLVPPAVSRARLERRDLHAQRLRTKEINRLATAVSRLGGPARLTLCGEPVTRLEYQTILAWTLRLNVAAIGFKYGEALGHGTPVVLYTPRPRGGWVIQGVHQRRPSCRSLAG